MYKLRVKIFLVTIMLALLGMVARLFHLQIVQGQRFRDAYEHHLERTEFVPAARGRILDRNQRILAMDYPCHDLCLQYGFLVQDRRWVRRQRRRIARSMKVSRERAKEVYDERVAHTWRLAHETARQMGVTLRDTGETQGVVDRIIRRVNQMRRRTGTKVREEGWAHVVVPALERDPARLLRAQLARTVGMAVRLSHKRRYPYGDQACHVIGFTGQVSESEQDETDPGAPGLGGVDWLTGMRQRYLDGDPIGKSGVEKMCESVLRGRRGYTQYQLTSAERVEVEAENGRDVHLTLDIELQKRLNHLFLTQRIEQLAGVTVREDTCSNGCIVVLTVPQGEVLAMVSVPTFDLNTYRKKYPRLLADRADLPMLHRAVAVQYPPGSTVKPIAALAALASGRIRRNTTFHCSGYLFPELRDRFRCWIGPMGGAHGSLNVVGGLRHSCNVFFYHVGERLGVAGMTDWFIRFGFGEPPGTGLPEERAGVVPRRDGPRGEARMMAIGQGPVLATPLHMANAMVTVARGGKFSSPLLALEGAPRQTHRNFPILPAHAEAVKRGLYEVVNESAGGTAYKIFHGPGIRPLGFEICGKTGTAQTPPHRADSNGDGRIDRHDRVIYSGDTAWFVGFAPYPKAQVAVAVVADHAGGGGKHAGPIARETFRLLRHMGYIR